jgi:hypothetical protein
MKNGRIDIVPLKVNVRLSLDVLMFWTSWHCRNIVRNPERNSVPRDIAGKKGVKMRAHFATLRTGKWTRREIRLATQLLLDKQMPL